MANHKERMLSKIESLGLIVVHSEIAPYGPGTRRYMVGKHIEQPIQDKPKHHTLGVQEWYTPYPLDGVSLENWLNDNEAVIREGQVDRIVAPRIADG